MTDAAGKDETTEKYFLKSERLGFRWWGSGRFAAWRSSFGASLKSRNILVDRFQRTRFENASSMSARAQDGPRISVLDLIQLLATGDFVGVCGLRPYRPAEDVIQLGFHVAAEILGDRGWRRKRRAP